MKFIGNRDIAVTIDDLDRSPDFYENVLGLKPKKLEEGLAVYDTGSFTLYVQQGTPHPPIPSFTVTSIQTAKQLLESSGCTIIEERESSLYFRDRDGIVWDIIEA